MGTAKSTAISIFWLRRDLRLEDNVGLAKALISGYPVLPVFIFDTDILDRLEDEDDARVEFIYDQIQRLKTQLKSHGSDLYVEYGRPEDVFKKLFAKYRVAEVYLNHDYEPYATERDGEIRKLARLNGSEFKTFKDHVIFEKMEIEKGTGGPYRVFTPYSRQWLKKLEPAMLRGSGSENHLDKLFKFKAPASPSLSGMGFKRGKIPFAAREFDRRVVKTYEDTRNVPAVLGTSRLGIHLRFGTVSIRDLVKKAQKTNRVYLAQLIWREFFIQILWNYPNVLTGPYKTKFAGVPWRNDKKDFAAWCEGRTGFPIVDAGMRELNATGFMHNRVRMIAASFLVKHLLIDYRLGEAYFARRLLDFELASNNGNWQWIAGCGCDASPYFRVFNPIEQLRRFDGEFLYVKQWIPEYGTDRYPEPIVDHKIARERVLKTFKDTIRQYIGY